MKGLLVFIIGCLFLLNSCNSNESTYVPPTSVHPFANYFYPYDSVARIYCYRDVKQGLDEEFHRIFGIKDSKGYHIVVEKYVYYQGDYKMFEAINYNYDSLYVQEYIVVDSLDRTITATIKDNKLFPWKKTEQATFMTGFPSSQKSIDEIKSIKTNINQTNIDHLVLGKEKRKSMILDEAVVETFYNIYDKKPITTLSRKGQSIFCEGFGLVEFYSKNKIVHYKLEKVLTQKEWKEFLHR
jgi:hypothetical protein